MQSLLRRGRCCVEDSRRVEFDRKSDGMAASERRTGVLRQCSQAKVAWFPWLAAQSTTQARLPRQLTLTDSRMEIPLMLTTDWAADAASYGFGFIAGDSVLAAVASVQMFHGDRGRSSGGFGGSNLRLHPTFPSSSLFTGWAKSRQSALSNERTDRAVSDSVGYKTKEERGGRERRRETGEMRSSVYGHGMLGLQSVALSLWSITDSGWGLQGGQARSDVMSLSLSPTGEVPVSPALQPGENSRRQVT
ncbi:hypothetical protein DL98DRAFT_131855 [Cadophora sp. DSE1049]|nr:hypothetical protein DL98DRAFT_131855 [Cadophora sp. DSE1049]